MKNIDTVKEEQTNEYKSTQILTDSIHFIDSLWYALSLKEGWKISDAMQRLRSDEHSATRDIYVQENRQCGLAIYLLNVHRAMWYLSQVSQTTLKDKQIGPFCVCVCV